MKVIDLKTISVFASWRNWVFVKLYTDEGIEGVGEAALGGREGTVETAIQELKRFLVGKNPLEIERNFHVMYRAANYVGGAVLTAALSAVEMAMWDILGKKLGTPVYQLLGGKCRDLVRSYANGWYTGARKPEEFASRSIRTVQRGYDALKFDPFEEAYLEMGRIEEERAVERVAAVREAVGETVELLIECHGRLSPASAIRVARRLERYRPFLLEEPIPPENLKALAHVAQATSIPIAVGERLYTRFDYNDLLGLGAVAYIQPDLCTAGGLSECKKIAAMAEPWHVMLIPHNPNGPVSTAACLQLAASTTNFIMLETWIDDVPWLHDIVMEPIRNEGCHLVVPDRSGLGVELNEEVAAAHPYQPLDLLGLRLKGPLSGDVLKTPFPAEWSDSYVSTNGQDQG